MGWGGLVNGGQRQAPWRRVENGRFCGTVRGGEGEECWAFPQMRAAPGGIVSPAQLVLARRLTLMTMAGVL